MKTGVEGRGVDWESVVGRSRQSSCWNIWSYGRTIRYGDNGIIWKSCWQWEERRMLMQERKSGGS